MRLKPRGKSGANKTEAKHKAFVQAYTTNGRNGSQAAIAAGYSAKGAHVAGIRLLRNATVAAMVGELTAKAEELSGLTAERALLENSRIALFDPGKCYKADGTAIPVHELDPATRAAISHEGKFGLVPHDKMRALDMAFKNLGLYEKDNSQINKPVSINMVFE